MTATVYFHTPGVLPLDAFNTFGANVKPNTENPIGYFGTGLKYAVAIIARLGGEISLRADGVDYQFYVSDRKFRCKTFQQVRMRKRRGLNPWRSSALPFTTELGKTWAPWKAYRELASNTLDEKGLTTTDPENPYPGGSTIAVKQEAILDCHLDPREIFLSDDGEQLFENHRFQIIKGRSRYIYYRGIRVWDLRYPSRVTYNFKPKHVTLTEDRTAANIWSMFYDIRVAIQSEIDDRNLLEALLKKEEDHSFEAEEINYDVENGTASPAWRSSIAALAATGSLGRAGLTASRLMQVRAPETAALRLSPEDWETVIASVAEAGKEGHERIELALQRQLDQHNRLYAKEEISF